MFSPAHALRLEAPIPPMPMAARFSLLLGASCPTARLGAMAADSAAIAAVAVNCLRETVRGESSRTRESSVDMGSHTATGSSCYTERQSERRLGVQRHSTAVALVFENLEDGMTIDELIEQFP